MNDGLREFLVAISRVEGGNYGKVGEMEEGATPFGAYGMLMENWDSWATAAGLSGHDKFDPAAQDYVASYWAQKLFGRYGDWDMVAMAWFAGAEQADIATQSGEGTGWFEHKRSKKFLEEFTAAREAEQQLPSEQQTQLPAMARVQAWTNPNGVPKGWLMPVAGKSEYSNSFRVPRNNKTGIHGAIDIYAKKGTPIVAPVGGKVLSTRKGDIGGYTVRMLGTDGLTYYFAHMNGQAVVRPGQIVQAGAHLGFVGDSGNAKGTTPHLHFSIHNGSQLVNPYSYLQGSRNAGNYYSPENAGNVDPTGETTSARYNGLLNAISSRVAGGERVDYRTVGVDTGLVDEPEENEVTSRERGPY